MASKLGFAAGIPERRVRPIWDAVDSRQYKNALKLATALLAKYPNSPYAIALKALIVERMGKADEALQLCHNAREVLLTDDSVYIDDLTLSTLQIVFQRLDQLNLATSCYEHACQKSGNNLELMMGLFNCHVREYSYVKQQQTAIKMYKLVGEERFLLWAICSIQLQVYCGDGGEKLLPLAEALLKKHIALHNLHEPEALLVYISILEGQGKYAAALDVLSGKLGSLLVIEVDKLKIQGNLLARASDHVHAAETFQKVLESCPDDWESFLRYLDCLLENTTDGFRSQECTNSELSNSTNLTDELIDTRLSNALSFIQKLQCSSGNDVRCPYLASIEIQCRRQLHRKIDDEKLVEDILEYFYRFGHLSCCSSDVEYILGFLSPNQKSKLLEKLSEHEQVSSVLSIKAVGQFITISKIRDSLGATFNISDKELGESAVKMVEIYCESLSLAKDLDPQESMHGEELLVIACNMLIQLYWRTHHLGYFYEAIMTLQFGLAIRSHVWQYKIHLLHLYSNCGALPSAYDCYRKLEIKNIMLETMSHHIVPQFLTSPFWSDLNHVLKDYLKFLDEYSKEAADLTFLAYRHRNYSKVLEFVKFRNRIVNSQQYIRAKIEISILQLKEKAESLEEVERFLESINFASDLMEISMGEKMNSLTFNDDLKTRPWWSPASDRNCLLDPFDEKFRGVAENMVKGSEARLLQTIRKRSFILRLVHLSLQISASSFQEPIKSNGSSCHDSVSELRSLLDQYALILGVTFDDAVKMLLDFSDGQNDLKDMKHASVDWINFAIFLNASMISCHVEGSGGTDVNGWKIVDGLIDKYVTKCCLSSGLHPIYHGSAFTVLVQLITESFAWHQLIIQSCIHALHPIGKRKRKGGLGGRIQPPVSQAIQSSIDCLCTTIENIMKWLAKEMDRKEDEKLDSLLSLVSKGNECGVGPMPGSVLQALEAARKRENPELEHRISQAMHAWSSVEVGREIVASQQLQISELHRMCNEKLMFLRTLKHSA